MLRVTLSPNRSYSVFDDCCRISGVSASNAGENNVNITVSGAWGKQAKDFLLLVAEKKSDGTLINAEKFLITPPICEESLDLEGNEFICSSSYEKKAEQSEIQVLTLSDLTTLKPIFGVYK